MFSQKTNFLRDQSGMKKQLLTLQQLIDVMDPELYKHLGISPSINRSLSFIQGLLILTQRKSMALTYSSVSGTSYTFHIALV